jgi:hypothetical protein
MQAILPDGSYPFIEERLPLSEMAMVEASSSLETLLRAQSEISGVEIIRGVPVELTVKTTEYPDATFLVLLPFEEDRLQMLVPKHFVIGSA